MCVYWVQGLHVIMFNKVLVLIVKKSQDTLLHRSRELARLISLEVFGIIPPSQVFWLRVILNFWASSIFRWPSPKNGFVKMG